MKKLIITANPVVKSLTNTIAEEIKKLSTKNGDDVEILDLYRTDLRQDFLSYEKISEIGNDITTKKIQEKIKWADELVFVFPIWWGDMPAIMKNFWDCNFTKDFAFKYEKGGKKVSLLDGKAARIIALSGAPSFFYKIILHVQLLWNLNRVGFCGIKQKSFTVFGEIDRTKTDKSKVLKKLNNLI